MFQTNQNTKMLAPFRFITSFAVSFGAGFLGMIFATASDPSWFAGLSKPAFTPFSWVFGPIWIMMYAFMASALLVIWNEGLRGEKEKMAFGLFFIHLFFNILWTVIFFGLHQLFFAFLVIVVLWMIVYSLTLQFYRINWFAGSLLLPYWAWLTFALFLNFFLWLYNR